jgi:hypothetical protein
LVRLREEFRRSGLREQENQITFAIRRADLEVFEGKLGEGRWKHGRLERAWNYIFFDLTCQYGMSPGRTLKILFGLIAVFSLCYVVAQKWAGSRGGIWAVWDEHRIHRDEGGQDPTRLTDGFPLSSFSESWLGRKCRALRLHVLGLALYFSLLSAFRIGWQEFNFGTWFVRMQPREYSLRATGWVRLVSGLQSLISVYLLALWVLTYFGTPFE